MLRLCSWFTLGLALALSVPTFVSGQEGVITGAIQVIDGDTIDVDGQRIRLHGIDAPERGQPCTTRDGQDWACGDWVTQQVRERFGGQVANCTVLDRDRYGRTVARCTVSGQDIGQVLVQEGLAFAYRKYSDAYDLDEKAAFVSDRGLHGFVMQSPARYRVMRRQGQQPGPGDCGIKGNINAKGAHIYHMPGQRDYDRTGINVQRGERFFCSEAQARASGWRKARR